MAERENFLFGNEPCSREFAPDLEELCRVHDVSLELIARSHDLDELLDLLLDEYEKRLAELPYDALDNLEDPAREEDPRLRALVMFAAQATALKSKAEAAGEIRRHADELQQALQESESARKRLQGVMEALDAGILILDGEGRVQDANRAAGELTGKRIEGLIGTDARPYLSGIERMSGGEVRTVAPSGGERTWLVTRNDLDPETGEEVVLIGDVTERDRETRQRHEDEKMGEVMQAVAVLAHKINNPLTALLGRSQLLSHRAGDDPKIAKATQVIEESAIRISELIRELAKVAKYGGGEEMKTILARMNPEPPSAPEEER